MSSQDDGGFVLPPKPKKRIRGHSIYLEDWMWERLGEISKVSGEYSRNEVMVIFLRDRIEAWDREQAVRRGQKK